MKVTCHTTDSRADVEHFLRSLPDVLAGNVPDRYGIARGMRARVGYTMLSLVKLDFEEKGRGRSGADGEKWKPLSKHYLAYQRPVTGRKPPKAGKHAPGGKDGFLTKAQLKRWRQIYARNLARFAVDMDLAAAKARAAAIAWTVLKQQGAQTKLEVFGNRQVGVDYQIGVNSGAMRNSLTPGQLNESGVDATYAAADESQVFEETQSSVVVGSGMAYAGAFHKLRKLWPDTFPDDWWEEITGAIVGGLVRIKELMQGGRI